MTTSRYRRVNLDGKSITETRAAKANVLPGTFVVIDADDEFAQATALTGRIYITNPAYHQGLTIRDAIPAGDSVVGEYVEEGRELAVLVPAGTYKKDSPIKLGADGKGALASADTESVIGYSQDEVTLKDDDFIRVRFRVGTVATATTD
ncbi:hypothetical protein GKR55_17505 [Providencia stuartii]|uniref:gp53 minor capsid family protein n=1 Tax=Providencia sp. PROV119 TaxID=2949830 RepID=UPI0012B63252|nr:MULTISPECIES: hypothetical protein [Providencia]EMD1716125.1 hypothetical protein [Providencia stuartii]MTB82278.1 hypothetical protein [Providencia stuartii]